MSQTVVIHKENEREVLISETLDSILTTKKISTNNIVRIAVHLMKIVESFNELSGLEKKQMVLRVIVNYIEKNVKGDEGEFLILFAESTLPSVIDIIISVDRKDVAIHIKKGLKKLFSCC